MPAAPRNGKSSRTAEAETPVGRTGTPIAVSAALRGRLLRLGLYTENDLLLHLPLRYEDETHVVRIADVEPEVPVQIEVEVLGAETVFRPRRQLVVNVRDESGSLVLRFINFYPSHVKTLVPGARIRCFGEARQGFFGIEMIHPRFMLVGKDEPLPTSLTPIYPTTAGVGQPVLRRLIASAFKKADTSEHLPEKVFHPLPDFPAAIARLHMPPPDASREALAERNDPAWRRIKFDELLAQQLMLQRTRAKRRESGAPVIDASGGLAGRLITALPFALTGAQRRVVDEIAADLARPFPMHRLLQGDVGSGKTIVAAYAACLAIESGYQVAFMAPTEILASQHYQKLSAWMKPLGIEVACLSSGSKGRRCALIDAARETPLVVGTHALIQNAIDYARLGLVIIDEQHRFGVAQRLALRKKGVNPHQLMMSATPIPRTLAMSYYADLDVSVIDELPPGRQVVATRLVSQAKRDRIVDYVRSACEQGQQVYWVCPLIEESETLQLSTALDTQLQLIERLPGLNVGLIHGRMKSEEKADVMRSFVDGKIQVLVATTVIEVGVDVANASLMVIEHAERYGLAQLHQLRGRVGRGGRSSVCVLIYADPLSAMARSRLKVIYQNNDGFEIARQDLQLRGPGEFVGQRQSGLPMLRYAELETDIDLVEKARNAASGLINADPAIVDRHLARWLPAHQDLLSV